MSDLIKRLRAMQRPGAESDSTVMCAEAADEIEALRAANDAFGRRQEWWTSTMYDLEQERDTLKRLVHEVMEANAAAGDSVHCRLLTTRQEYAWRALNDACRPNARLSGHQRPAL